MLMIIMMTKIIFKDIKIPLYMVTNETIPKNYSESKENDEFIFQRRYMNSYSKKEMLKKSKKDISLEMIHLKYRE